MSNIVVPNGTFLTDLKVGDKVIEFNRLGNRFVSTVKSINNTKIVVTRPDNSGDYTYCTRSGRPRPYIAMTTGWFLQQYIDPAIGTIEDPGPIPDNAESLIPTPTYQS